VSWAPTLLLAAGSACAAKRKRVGRGRLGYYRGVHAVTQRIGVVGLGRLGTCLVRAFHSAGLGPVCIASARFGSAQRLATELGPMISARQVVEVVEQARLIFLAVPDDRVAEVCAQLPVTSAHALVHLSGALDRATLSTAQLRGADSAVFHPLQAFAIGASATRFVGIHIGIEAEESLAGELSSLARALGATPFSLLGVDRAAYHASAVFASNYLVALYSAATRAWQIAGLPAAAARSALAPLSRGALEAIVEHELPSALTGPLQRGDIATLERHLHALAADPATEQLYRSLASELLSLPLALDPEVRARLERLIGHGS
jgi:predicted short-subunit dehydrogenase-like oxidoreductase (DUF2520 family)